MSGMKTLLGLILGGALLASASPQPAPQTARQALIEMFFSKTPGTLEKHLPEATRAALRKAANGSPTSMLDGFATLTSQLQARGQSLQTFEAGPTLLLMDDPQSQSKFEITVERDDLRADEDQIEVSFQAYKEGQPQTAGVNPHLTFTMKQEKSVWRLDEITVAVRVSLSDPQFLKAMTTKMNATVAAGSSSQEAPTRTSTLGVMSAANEASAVASVRAINTAEATYATAYPGHGYTCTLSDLGGMGGGGGADEHHAMFIDPRLASGKKNGYMFRLSGCEESPAYRFRVTAVPADPGSGARAFCSDETAVIRFATDNNAASCLSVGTPLQ